MYLIDTNIHIAYLLQNFEKDVLTSKYIALYQGIVLQNRVIPDFILAEFEVFMMQVVPSRYKLSLEDKKNLKQLTLEYIAIITEQCTVIGTEIEIVQRARNFFLDYAQTYYLSFFDCLILATAEVHKYTILSKDQKLIIKAQELQLPVLKP